MKIFDDPHYKMVLICFCLLLPFSFYEPSLSGESIVGSRHDLSSGSSPEVCVFCHTPHLANPDVSGPLWNRAGTVQSFTPYASSTSDTVSGVPSPSSLVCLGCHDGVRATIAVHGVARDNKHHLVNYHGFPDNSSYPNCERCHSDLYTGRPPNLSLGTYLGDDHPISMDYPTPVEDPDFHTPPDSQNGWGEGDVKLVDGKMECISCHNVHDPAYAPFLNKSNNGSALCVTCHDK